MTKKDVSHFDFAVIGSGPAGQKAAIQAAKLHKKVCLIEQSRELGGSCVHRGTIPSKTLRENALRLKNMRMNAELAHFELPEDTELTTLIDRLEDVLAAHDEYMRRQVERNKVELLHGKAAFVSAKEIEITTVNNQKRLLTADKIIIATGSSPRMPDHIHILLGLRPEQSISELVQKVKASSSKWINEQSLTKVKFFWQEGFGAFSYTKSDLPKVIKYIENQKKHHKKTTFLEEYNKVLKDLEVDFDPKYLFHEPQ